MEALTSVYGTPTYIQEYPTEAKLPVVCKAVCEEYSHLTKAHESCIENCIKQLSAPGLKDLIIGEDSSEDSFSVLSYSQKPAVESQPYNMPKANFIKTSIDMEESSSLSLSNIIGPTILAVAGTMGALYCFNKAMTQTNRARKLGYLALATLGLLTTAYITPEYSPFLSVGVFGTWALLRYTTRKKPAEINTYIPKRRSRSEPQAPQSFKRPPNPVNCCIQAPQPEPPTTWLLAECKDPSVLHSLQEAHLDPTQVDKALEERKKRIFKNGIDAASIERYTQTVKRLTMTCTSCRARNDFDKSLFENILQLCPVCKQVSYCSTECQKQDWPIHKLICKKPAKLSET